MRKKYRVRWYEYNLTVLMHRNFFTEIGATIFHLWLRFVKKEKSIIYEYED